MADGYDVIVIGAGAVGAACARELAWTGRRVLALDRDADQGDAWRAAAGMLAAQIEAQPDDPLFELGLAGRERLVELAGPLLESTGIDIGLWQQGIARLAMDEDELPGLKATAARQRQQGHLCDWLDPGEVRARWPWAGPSLGALWAPRDAALEPVRLVEALRADAQRLGAELAVDEISSLERRGDRVTGVRGRERTYLADQVVIAAGAWSGLIGGVPRPLSVEPVRGQMAALPWPPAIPAAILYTKDCYILQRGDAAVVGSTMEYAGFRPEVTSAGLARLFTTATTLCPALAKLDVRRTWAGLRPMTPDGHPVVGAEPRMEGLWYATGHGRNGILLSAITGIIIRQLLDHQQPTFEELSALSPDRFWRW